MKKTKKKKVIKQRNWIAVAAHFKSGAGRHKDKSKYTRKEKHKGRSKDLPNFLAILF